MYEFTSKTAMAELWDHLTGARNRPWIELDLSEPEDGPTRYLSTMEMATLKAVVDTTGPGDPLIRSTASEAALRMRVWAARGRLQWKSGWDLADELHHYFYPQSHAARVPYRGLELLRHVDTSDSGVTIWVDTLDTDDRYHTVRLHERLAGNRVPSAASVY